MQPAELFEGEKLCPRKMEYDFKVKYSIIKGQYLL